jgi:hypothetical protein
MDLKNGKTRRRLGTLAWLYLQHEDFQCRKQAETGNANFHGDLAFNQGRGEQVA